MTNEAKLTARRDAARTAYDLARAARQDSGSRIESAREAKARQRYDAATDALHTFRASHPA